MDFMEVKRKISLMIIQPRSKQEKKEVGCSLDGV